MLTLIQAALNKIPADLLVRNARVANVLTGEVLGSDSRSQDPYLDIAIWGEYIAAVEPSGAGDGGSRRAREVIDANGQMAVPGLIDSHLHIESSLVTPAAFAQAVLPHGVTTVAEDPHEIANATGLTGVRLFLEASRDLPLSILFLASTCVPAAAGLEHCRGELGPAEIVEMLTWDGVIGLAEVMDARAVVQEEPRMSAILEAGRRAGAIIEGHNPMLEGRELQAYIAAGVDSDHTLATPERILQKLRLGVTVQLQERYMNEALIAALNALPQAPANLCLVTDDVAPDYLEAHGHLDHVLRRAIALGMPPMQALQAATINPARRLRLYDRGAIAPGKRADLLLVDSLEEFQVSTTISGGRVVARDGQQLWRLPLGKQFGELSPEKQLQESPYGKQYRELSSRRKGLAPLRDSLDLRPVTEEAFLPNLPQASGARDVRVIIAHRHGTTTEEGRARVTFVDGAPQLQETDLSLIAVLARGERGRAVGFLRGLGLQQGAVATTHAHDSHNLAVIGRDRRSMVAAANAVIETGGGIALALSDELRAFVPLPIAGIISDQPLSTVAEQMRHFTKAIADLGVRHPHLLMRLTTFTLPVSSGLRITDMGYVRASERALVPLTL